MLYPFHIHPCLVAFKLAATAAPCPAAPTRRQPDRLPGALTSVPKTVIANVIVRAHPAGKCKF